MHIYTSQNFTAIQIASATTSVLVLNCLHSVLHIVTQSACFYTSYRYIIIHTSDDMIQRIGYIHVGDIYNSSGIF